MHIDFSDCDPNATIIEPEKGLFGISSTSKIVKNHFSIRSHLLSLRKELAMINAHVKHEKSESVSFALLHITDSVSTIALNGSFRVLLYLPANEEPIAYSHIHPADSLLNGNSDSIHRIQYHTFDCTRINKIVLENPNTKQRLSYTFTRI